MEKDYCGDGGYINGLGFRVRGERPVTFSKSVLNEEEEYYYDEYGVRHKKRDITELQDISVEEISYVDSPVTRKKFMVIKGDDKEMNEEKELKGWEDVSEKELSVIRETVSILNKYDLVDDLKRAKETLTKYFGESEVKKYNERCEWNSVQNCVFGYDEDALSFINEDIEIEKGSPDDKFPSLTRQFNINKKRLEKAYEEYAIESRTI